MGQKIITLLTDFGLADPYVGVMKGVMLGINPNLTFVDITHSIPSGDVKRGAFRLFTAYKYFPNSTIHLTVIDPGVGTKRKPIIVETNNYYFVGPDNGVFSWIYAKEKFKVHKIDINRDWRVSNTFHGRDIFAPIAAKLSLGVKIEELGPCINTWVEFKIPTPVMVGRSIHGEVIDIDQFGNLITTISTTDFHNLIHSGTKFEIKIKGYIIHELKTCYEGETPIAIFGSSDLLEISLPNGNCSSFLDAKIGTKVVINYFPFI